MPLLSREEAVSKRDLLWACAGAIAAVLFSYSTLERQAAWSATTVACWPNREYPNPTPARHP